jgi:dTDP-glucose pyrophosphorylase
MHTLHHNATSSDVGQVAALSLLKIHVLESATILDALRTIDGFGAGLAIAVDVESKVVGVLTDGDIRRLLISGGSLNDSVSLVVRRDFLFVDSAATRAEVLDLMIARRINAVPVIESRKLVGLHVHDDLIGPVPVPNLAVILAGGRGRRLGELTANTPKPMLLVAGRPVLERLVLHLVGSGISQIAISVGYLADHIVRHFGDGSKFGCSISYLVESEDDPLGTAGPLSLLPTLPQHPTLVINGDVVSNFNVRNLIVRHEEDENDVTIGLHSYVHQVPFGVVHMHGDQVLEVQEKPKKIFPVNAGVYLLNPTVISGLPRASFASMTDVINNAISSQKRVAGLPLDADWFDVGSPKDLDEARGVRQ